MFSMLAETLSQSSKKKKKNQKQNPISCTFLSVSWGGRILRNCLRASLTLPEIRPPPPQKKLKASGHNTISLDGNNI